MHCLTDFKNFARAEVNLFEPLTVLLGRNGSGNTNLIEGVFRLNHPGAHPGLSENVVGRPKLTGTRSTRIEPAANGLHYRRLEQVDRPRVRVDLPPSPRAVSSAWW